MDKTRLRVVYQEEKPNPLQQYNDDNVVPISKKSICIDKGKEGAKEFNFTEFYTRPQLAMWFVESIWKLKGKSRLATIEGYRQGMRVFWRFLDEIQKSDRPIYELRQIDRYIIKMYIRWLKDHTKWVVGSQINGYVTVKALLVYLMRHYPEEVSADLAFPVNPFPGSNAQQRHRDAYSPKVIGQLIKAIVVDLEEIYRKVETPYVKTGKGVDPRGLRGSGRSLYKDFDNMIWYFENLLDCQYRVPKEIRNLGHGTFMKAAGIYHGGLRKVWELLGAWAGTRQEMLVPFVLVYTYLSGGNPGAIKDMERDCIKYEPLTKRRHVEMRKARGKSVQKIKHSPRCVTIVERVLELTGVLAAEAGEHMKDFVWLYRGRKGDIRRLNLGGSAVLHALSVFVKKHDIRDDDGKPLKLNLARLRPTFATEAFLKTKGDLVKLKQLLGHSSIATTQQYVSAAMMPEMLENAAADLSAHESEMKARIVVGDVASELDISKEEAGRLLSGDFDTFLSKCMNPLNSPLKGEQEGKMCSRFHACLRCGHSLITSEDLTKIFSYQNSLIKIGGGDLMSTEQFEKAFGSDIRLINNIASRFPAEVVEGARRKALKIPCPQWDAKIIVAQHLLEEGL